MQHFLPILLLGVLTGLPAQATQTIVIPNGTGTTEGNTSNLFPWGRGGAGLRIQCLYDSANFTAQGVTSPIRITRLRFRPDANLARTWSATGYQTASVSLSTSPFDYAAASTTFAANAGADQVVVYSGSVAWPAGSSTAPGPAPFLIDLPLSTPFVYDPSAGDLNIDTDLPVQAFTGSNLPIDVQTTGSLSSRVYVGTGYPSGQGTVNVNHGVVVEVSYDALPPSNDPCSTDEHDAWLAQTVPGYVAERQRVLAEIDTRAQLLDASTANRMTQEFVIPVVVHVVWKTAAQQVGLAQIQSQIDALNRDFSASNSDIGNVPSEFAGVVVDPRIRFVLAQRDPACNPTNGITYRQTTEDSFSANGGNKVKFFNSGGTNAWPSTDYLNLWVCNLSDANGYAQFPWGPQATDGIVVRYTVLGTTSNVSPPNNLGRTAVHEVGHWLGLYHLFQGDCSGTDLVDDTPQSPYNPATSGCPTHPHVRCGHNEMIVNYMLWTYHTCRRMFTVGQALRMEATLSVVRASLQNSNGHIPPSFAGPDLWIADDTVDTGAEPNVTSPYMWTSSDIWMRNTLDGQLVHQNPDYASSTNRVYVRVRNRACVAAPAGALLKVYWAKASTGLSWPTPWDDNSTNPPDMGNLIGTVVLPGIPAGRSAVFALPWAQLPNPVDYASFGADRSHFCLLARIETVSTPPYGMTVPETGDLYANVKENNNIAWKNITVLCDGCDFIGVAMAANYTAQAQQLRFVVGLGAGTPSQLPTGSLRLKFTDTLVQKWILGGSLSSGMQRVPGTNMFDCLNDGAYLGNITLNPGEVSSMEVRVGPGLQVGPKRTIVVHIEQRLEAGLRLVGGQDFVLPIGVDFDSGHTSKFGVACAGTGGLRPDLAARTLPAIGSTFTLNVTRARAVSPGGLLLSPVGINLNLGGCPLYVGQPMVSLPFVTSGTGSAAIAIPIPLTPAYVGASLTFQGIVVDPSGALLNMLSTTNGLEAVIGR